MKTVRRLKCNANLDTVFKEGRVFIEYATFPGFFYPEEELNPNGVGVCEAFLRKIKIDQHFEEIDSIPFKETAWYRVAKEEIELEIDNAKLGVEIAQQKYNELVELSKLFQE